MRSGEMKHGMTLFHTMGPNRNVLFQTHILLVTIYGFIWSSFTYDDAPLLHCVIGYATSHYLCIRQENLLSPNELPKNLLL